jgi:hypothetical protein
MSSSSGANEAELSVKFVTWSIPVGTPKTRDGQPRRAARQSHGARQQRVDPSLSTRNIAGADHLPASLSTHPHDHTVALKRI